MVYKTHLDIGFTDFSQNVLDKYVNEHIPHAIDLANKLNTEDNKKFIWTVGSYLIDYYLKHADREAVKRLEEAIKRGDVCWHGLACTTHTELLDRELLDFNLGISDNLDKQFGRKTIAAKMTDVPGHTRAMVESLFDHGIKYLHLGVNPSSMVPGVPLSFVWRTGDKDVIVQYSFKYGTPCYVDGMDEVLEFSHTGDNHGPQSVEVIQAEIDRIQAAYPNAVIEASTIDQYVKSLVNFKDTLPVIEEEIGDTWIHGIATDPLKVMRYRALIQLKNQWTKEGLLTKEMDFYPEFMINLLLIAEHTWGLNFQAHLADFTNWEKKDFQAARKADITNVEFFTNRNASMVKALEENFKQYPGGEFIASYQRFESSHEEQMNYIWKAIDALPLELESKARREFQRLESISHDNQDTNGEYIAYPYEHVAIGPWEVAFGGNGEIVYLAKNNKEWIRDGHFGRLVYSTYNAIDCANNYYTYNRGFRENQWWSESDFSKPGVEFVENLEHREYKFGVQSIKILDKKVIINLQGNKKAVEEYGCPAHGMIQYNFGDTIDCCLNWTEKDANKMPEALWFDMNFDVENVNRWKMNKMGHMVSPGDVVKGGNRRQHCVEEMTYSGADGKISVKNIHSPLISVGGHWLYGDYRPLPDIKEGFSYCLFNNKWGTNFKMWCEDDCTFEFGIRIDNN